MSRLLFCIILYFKLVCGDLENIHKRHEYNLTFKGPIMLLPNTNEIPFFEIGGHVIPGKDRVRLTTSLPDQQGWIWSKGASNFEGFQIDIDFRITGSGRVGADGFAVWVVKDKSAGGNALGSNHIWNGLGVLFDTYDNNGLNDNPIVLAIINDGSKSYLSQTDGHDISSGHCIRDYRNRPHHVHTRIMYFNGTLEVALSSGIETVDSELETCIKMNANLPRMDYYFGLSAATGTIADDHDIERFEVHSLWDIQNVKMEEEKVRLAKMKEYEEDFQKRLNNLTKADENVKPSHPTQSGDIDIDRNLFVIFQEIVNLNKGLKEIKKSIDELKKSKFSKSQNNSDADLIVHIESMKKDFHSIKSGVDLLTGNSENSNPVHQQQQSTNQLQSAIEKMQNSLMKEFEKISSIQNDIHHIQNTIQDAKKSTYKEEACGTCISTMLFLFISSLQTGKFRKEVLLKMLNFSVAEVLFIPVILLFNILKSVNIIYEICWSLGRIDIDNISMNFLDQFWFVVYSFVGACLGYNMLHFS